MDKEHDKILHKLPILGVSVDEMCPAGTFTYRTRLGGIVLLKDGNGALCDGCARHVHQLGI